MLVKNNKFYSLVGDIIDTPSITLRYYRKRWTRPVVGKLFVFESLEAARAYYKIIYVSDETKIFVCEALNVSRITKRIAFGFNFKQLKLFWAGDYARYIPTTSYIPTTHHIPTGTLGAEAVKLLEEVSLD